ncbi:MAG TPA: glycosyltransferase 87 family protein [Anaerolineales bacterium]
MKHSIQPGRSSRVLATSLAALILLPITIWFIGSRLVPSAWDFRNNLWGPAYLLVHGLSPYNIHVIFQGSNAIWMPTIVGALFPIGFLQLQWASNLWLLLSLAALYLTVALLAAPFKKPPVWTILAALALAIFPSTLSHLRLGQASLLVCLALVLLSVRRAQLSASAAGALLALSLAKPQLLLFFLPVYLLVTYREQGPGRMLRVMLFTALWSLAFCIPLFVAFPNWIPDLLHNLAINNPWFYPSLYSLLVSTLTSGVWAAALAGVYLVLGLAIAVWAAFKLDGLEALLWALALTTVFSPVIWSWDFVLLYPLLVFMAFASKSRSGARVLYCGYAACTIAFMLIKIRGFVGDQFAMWVPPFLIATLVISRLLSRSAARRPQLAPADLRP